MANARRSAADLRLTGAAAPERITTLRALLIVATVLIVYYPALGGGFLWDDDLYVTDNPALRSTAGLLAIWKIPPSTRQYYPVTFTSFWLEYRFWGEAAFGYHATNVVLHAANALLVWRVLALLEVPGAFLAALIFAVHPLHAESVAWIAERKNVLSGFFSLLAVLAWLRFLDDGRRRALYLTAGWFVLALLSKTQVCALPLILWLITWWRRPERLKATVAPLAVLAVVSFAGALATVRFEHGTAEVLAPMPHLDPLARILVAGRALWFYFGSLLWPANLRAIYGQWAIDAHDLRQLLFPIAAAAAMLLLWVTRGRIGKAPFTAAAVFVLCLAPALGFLDFNFMRYAFVADHFAYLASIPLLAAIAAAATRAAARTPALSARGLEAAIVGVLVAVLGAATWSRAAVHADAERLWRDNIARDPSNAAAYNHLGSVLFNRGRTDEAIEAFRAAVALDADFADAHHHWGMALQRQGRFDDAIAQYNAALALRPDSSALRNSVGVALQAKGEADAAIQAYAEALRLDPTYAPAHSNWGTILITRGDAAGAAEHFHAAVELQPGYAEAQDNWGLALAALGRPEEAAAHYAAAVELNPKLYGPRRHLGDALLALGRYEAAAEEYRAATRIAPSRAAAHQGLGAALLALGRVEAAIAELSTASRLDPTNAEIENQWGEALLRAGDGDEAAEHFSAALGLRPNYAEARANLARAMESSRR